MEFLGESGLPVAQPLRALDGSRTHAVDFEGQSWTVCLFAEAPGLAYEERTDVDHDSFSANAGRLMAELHEAGREYRADSNFTRPARSGDLWPPFAKIVPRREEAAWALYEELAAWTRHSRGMRTTSTCSTATSRSRTCAWMPRGASHSSISPLLRRGLVRVRTRDLHPLLRGQSHASRLQRGAGWLRHRDTREPRVPRADPALREDAPAVLLRGPRGLVGLRRADRRAGIGVRDRTPPLRRRSPLAAGTHELTSRHSGWGGASANPRTPATNDLHGYD